MQLSIILLIALIAILLGWFFHVQFKNRVVRTLLEFVPDVANLRKEALIVFTMNNSKNFSSISARKEFAQKMRTLVSPYTCFDVLNKEIDVLFSSY